MNTDYLAAKYYSTFCRASRFFNKMSMRIWYGTMALYNTRRNWRFMNYGYAALHHQKLEPLLLRRNDESDRCSIQLYHHVVDTVDIEDKAVLDVGSGRGGGAYYIDRYLEPQKIVGFDFSKRAVAICNRYYRNKRLHFVFGDAEHLPFDDETFDIVINVESSHSYRSMESFLSNVNRVLRPQGFFLFADFRDVDRIDVLNQQLHSSGLRVIREVDITSNVLKALELDGKRKSELIYHGVPRFFYKIFKQFAGVPGTNTYKCFRTRETIYRSYVLQKS